MVRTLTSSATRELDELTARWAEAMLGYAGFLVQQRDQKAEVAATLTRLELPNLFAFLDHVHAAGDVAATIDLATSLFRLLQNAGKPRLLERVAAVREAAAATLGESWNHARFEAERTRIEQQLAGGGLREALDGASQLLERARAAGEQAYDVANYDLAVACWLAARVLRTAGGSQQALPLLDEARQRSEAIVVARRGSPDPAGTADRKSPEEANIAAIPGDLRSNASAGSGDPRTAGVERPRTAGGPRTAGSNASAGSGDPRTAMAAEGMASACLTEQGDCLLDIGRLDEAAAAYEECIRRSEQQGDERQVAVGQIQLGTVRLYQRRYPEALAAYAEARERFTGLGEPGSVAVAWHQTGMAYQEAGQPEAAEDAYRKSLAIEVRLGNVAGQASTLNQLGNLYKDVLDRPEEAAAFYRQAADKYVEIGDTANEGRARNNLADTLRKLGRLDEARQEIRRAITCKEPYGHAALPWSSWAIFAAIETAAGNAPAAAAARQKAIDCYLAYRRDGGENHYTDGRISLAVTPALVAGNAAEAATLLDGLAADVNLPARLGPFIAALQQIAAGSRDRTLADNPELNYRCIAEILFLIETLEQKGERGT